MSALIQTRWRPVEACAWKRRAFGRRVVCETHGGALRARLPNGPLALQEMHLSMAISGRMLVQLFINDALHFEELVSNGELDRFIGLTDFAQHDALDLELDLIPATTGEAHVTQRLIALPRSQNWPGLDGPKARPSRSVLDALLTEGAD